MDWFNKLFDKFGFRLNVIKASILRLADIQTATSRDT